MLSIPFAIQPIGGSGDWVTPFIFDPTANARMFVGKGDVYRSEDGATNWTTLNSPFSSDINCTYLPVPQ